MLRSASGLDLSAVFNDELDVKRKGGFGRSSLRHYLVRRWADVRVEFLDALERLVGRELSSVDVLSDHLDVGRVVAWFTRSQQDGQKKEVSRVTYSQFIYHMMV